MDIGRQSRRQRVVEAYGRDFIKKEKGGKKNKKKETETVECLHYQMEARSRGWTNVLPSFSAFFLSFSQIIDRKSRLLRERERERERGFN